MNTFKLLATATVIRTVVFNPHIDEDPRPRRRGHEIRFSKFDGQPAMYFLPYVLFCRLASRAIGNYQRYPNFYKFSLKIKRTSQALKT